MLTPTKIRKILEKLADSKSVTILVDQNSNLKIKRRRNTVKVEGLIETDKEYLIEAIQFHLPYLKVK